MANSRFPVIFLLIQVFLLTSIPVAMGAEPSAAFKELSKRLLGKEFGVAIPSEADFCSQPAKTICKSASSGRAGRHQREEFQVTLTQITAPLAAKKFGIDPTGFGLGQLEKLEKNLKWKVIPTMSELSDQLRDEVWDTFRAKLVDSHLEGDAKRWMSIAIERNIKDQELATRMKARLEKARTFVGLDPRLLKEFSEKERTQFEVNYLAFCGSVGLGGGAFTMVDWNVHSFCPARFLGSRGYGMADWDDSIKSTILHEMGHLLTEYAMPEVPADLLESRRIEASADAWSALALAVSLEERKLSPDQAREAAVRAAGQYCEYDESEEYSAGEVRTEQTIRILAKAGAICQSHTP